MRNILQGAFDGLCVAALVIGAYAYGAHNAPAKYMTIETDRPIYMPLHHSRYVDHQINILAAAIPASALERRK
ncbi:MAG: hypothetical protein KGL39_48640 [Patescibacteria group bacterium]|nr:hypothetical protein [Patescibacteria group bacterium]